jgi:NTP pyrophosphatase (non-canonical NTP hydrolase)
VSLANLQQRLRAFAAERDWEQFHTPKNLVMALAAEVGELGDLFQWLTPEESWDVRGEGVRRSRVEEEMADVLGYLLRLADVLDVDLEQALTAKMAVNAQKYPLHLARGNARKYTDLGGPGSPGR